jgi:hypothetical protein
LVIPFLILSGVCIIKQMLIYRSVSTVPLSQILIKGFSGTEAVAGLGGLQITKCDGSYALQDIKILLSLY